MRRFIAASLFALLTASAAAVSAQSINPFIPIEPTDAALEQAQADADEAETDATETSDDLERFRQGPNPFEAVTLK